MQKVPLSINPLVERAGRLFPQVEIVSRLTDKSLRRHRFADFQRHTRRLGAAVPEALICAFAQHGAEIRQGWGMTETSPVGSIAYLKPELRTGDVASIDPHGYIRITDRTKDLIKSGGERISSVGMENLLMAHPPIQEAAVIAIPDPKWSERPLACVVLKPVRSAAPDELRERFAQA